MSEVNPREDSASTTWNCDRCLTLSSSLQELLHTVKILSERIQSLEAINEDLSRRLEFLGKPWDT